MAILSRCVDVDAYCNAVSAAAAADEGAESSDDEPIAALKKNKTTAPTVRASSLILFRFKILQF